MSVNGDDPCRACALRTAAALGWTLDDAPPTVVPRHRCPVTRNARSKLPDRARMAGSPELPAEDSARAVVGNRGRTDDEQVAAFVAAG